MDSVLIDEVAALFELGVKYRQECRFGDAINVFASAVEIAEKSDCSDEADKNVLQEIKEKSLASIELMQEINGFVNMDLMNP